jgi:predicted metal-dependent peptidase
LDLMKRKRPEPLQPSSELTEEILRTLVGDRGVLATDLPLFGYMGLKLKLVADYSSPTMWVDGVSLGVNPLFAKQCNTPERRGVVVHEIYHVANGHPWRRNGRLPDLWNEACDYAINPLVLETGFPLPGKPLLDAKYFGKSAEAIYDLLWTEQASKPKGSSGSTENSPSGDNSSGSGGSENGGSSTSPEKGEESGTNAGSTSPGQRSTVGSPNGAANPRDSSLTEVGEVRDAPAGTSPAELDSFWRSAIMEGAQVARMLAGKLPGNMELVVKEAGKSRIPWRELLHQFVQRSHTDLDWTWQRPSRRHVWRGVYLPSLRGENIPSIFLAVDTSMSTYGLTLAEFKAGAQSLHQEMQPDQTWVAYSDAKVQRVDEFTRDDTLNFAPVGGGGTDFRPVFEWIKDQGVDPTCLIYLTDLEGKFPKEEPDFPVLWVSPVTRARPPWGEHVEIC